MSPALALYLDAVVFAFGAVVGSFLNVCVHRMPRDESVVSPPSHCPSCNRRIRWFDNIPLVSYLVLGGRCRYCQARFSARYFLVELLTGLLFLATWLAFRGWTIPVIWLLLAGMIVATFIDFEHYIIPNEITYGGIVAGLVLSPVNGAVGGGDTILGSVLASVAGILVGGLSLLAIALLGEKLFKKEAMGMGDVKFLAAIGAFLGWKATVFTIVISSFVGAFVGLALIALHRKSLQARIPYGPYLALAALVWVFWGPDLLDWYFNFLAG